MASNYDITMRQFNGIDYDTLYPKTILSQIGDLANYAQINSSGLYLPNGAKSGGILDMNGNRITNVANPSQSNDAANMNYVDTTVASPFPNLGEYTLVPYGTYYNLRLNQNYGGIQVGTMEVLFAKGNYITITYTITQEVEDKTCYPVGKQFLCPFGSDDTDDCYGQVIGSRDTSQSLRVSFNTSNLTFQVARNSIPLPVGTYYTYVHQPLYVKDE